MWAIYDAYNKKAKYPDLRAFRDRDTGMWMLPCHTDVNNIPQIRLPWGPNAHIDLDKSRFVRYEWGWKYCNGTVQYRNEKSLPYALYGTWLFQSAQIKFEVNKNNESRVGFAPFSDASS